MELSAGTAASVSAPEWKAMNEETFFYWRGVSTAKEENPAGSMMAADNQKVVLISFFFCFLPSEGFLAAASLSFLGSTPKFGTRGNLQDV